MCKSCAQPVQTVSKSSGRVYNLCAAAAFAPGALWISAPFSTNCTHNHSQVFSTIQRRYLPLLRQTFSTLSTRPITRIINVYQVI